MHATAKPRWPSRLVSPRVSARALATMSPRYGRSFPVPHLIAAYGVLGRGDRLQMTHCTGCSNGEYSGGLVTTSLCTTLGGLSRHLFRFSTQPTPQLVASYSATSMKELPNATIIGPAGSRRAEG